MIEGGKKERGEGGEGEQERKRDPQRPAGPDVCPRPIYSDLYMLGEGAEHLACVWCVFSFTSLASSTAFSLFLLFIA